jgi:hypothetical protein
MSENKKPDYSEFNYERAQLDALGKHFERMAKQKEEKPSEDVNPDRSIFDTIRRHGPGKNI